VAVFTVHGAGVLLTDILDHRQLRRHVFIPLARLFPDRAQILVAFMAMLFPVRQIVHDAFAFQVMWKGLSAAASFLRTGSGNARRVILIGVIRLRGCFCFSFCLPRLPGGREQRQLVR
jgi:hypothetical protein